MVMKVRIGKCAIGLIGLEAALKRLEDSLSNEGGLHCISPEEAAQRLLEALEKRNYIPATSRNAYIRALAELWKKRTGSEDEATGESSPDSGVLTIRILGPGCLSCDKLETMVTSAMQKLGIAADIEHVRELDEIWRYGVINTPALVINDKVLCSGRLPTPAQVEHWIKEIHLAS